MTAGEQPREGAARPARPAALAPLHNLPAPRGRLCLFGKPDPSSSARLLDEHFIGERRRVMERWGFDILTEEPAGAAPAALATPKKTRKPRGENKENVDVSGKLDAKKAASPARKSLKMTTEKSHLRGPRQAQVTDYWRSRKFSESSSCSEKEN